MERIQLENSVIITFANYWQRNSELIRSLPYTHHSSTFQGTPTQESMQAISLPFWAKDLSVNECLLVPIHYLSTEKSALPHWQRIDWIGVMFWYTHSLAEKAFEHQNGTIHSYSMKLKNFDERLWQHAWANRIGLFLRRWAAHENKQDEDILFGKLPKYKIYLTHDVDAIKKTTAIRIKQTIFCTYNCLRSLLRLKLNHFFCYLKKSVRFLASNDNYWCFNQIQTLEKHYQKTSYYHFYAGQQRSNFKLKLLDPGYSIDSDQVKKQLHTLLETGNHIGLHQSFNSWHNSNDMKKEKVHLQYVSNTTIRFCRQHWLRFSFKDTWQAQAEAGFKLDFTLGFNDRPGFRNASAIAFQPLDENQKPINIKAIPTLFMDSHFFDYALLSKDERIKQMKQWLDEVKFVNGEAAIIWHQRVFSKDYQWGELYEELLKYIS